MNGGNDGFWISACAVAVSSASMAAYGLRQHRLRGWWHWQLAMALAAAGMLAAAAAGRHLAGALVAQVLLLHWPVLMLIGMRHFHARIDWPASERSDWAVLAGVSVLVLVSPLLPGDGGAVPLVASLATLATHLYAASLLVCGATRPDGLPMRLLGADLALVALAPMPFASVGSELLAGLEGRAVATAVGAFAAAFVIMLLVFERRERQQQDTRRRQRTPAQGDVLTGMSTGRQFRSQAARALHSDPPGGAALLCLDIDHFKRLNTDRGKAAGDRALCAVSRCLQDTLRARDLVCRQGSDEFAMLLRRASVREAVAVAERLATRLREEHAEPPLTLSVGVVQVRPTEPVEDALRRAGQALLEAKRRGHARVVAAGVNTPDVPPGKGPRLDPTPC